MEDQQQALAPALGQPETDSSAESAFDSLQSVHFLAYGVGHMLNDLTVTLWFYYLLYFLKQIVETPAASLVLLVGQAIDGVSILVLGPISDRTITRFGKRKPWYLFGVVLSIVGFLPTCQNYRTLTGSTGQSTLEYVYYIVACGLYSLGWAALQISHMSLVPSLTCSTKRRVHYETIQDKLNNLKNTFTFVSYFVVLGFAVMIFQWVEGPAFDVALISYFCVVVGLPASIFFMWKIDEVRLSHECEIKQERLKKLKADAGETNQHLQIPDKMEQRLLDQVKRPRKLTDWLRMPSFYIFGVCFMAVRLYTNLFGTFILFYLRFVIQLGVQGNSAGSNINFAQALIPLTVCLSSVCCNLSLSSFYSRFGRKVALMIGGMICAGTSAGMYFLTKEVNWPIYPISVLIGISQPMVLSTGLNLISQVIGTKGKQGAVVFSTYSFVDKVSVGIVIYFVTNAERFTAHDSEFIRLAAVLIPSASCILACLVVVWAPVKEYNKKMEGKGILDELAD